MTHHWHVSSDPDAAAVAHLQPLLRVLEDAFAVPGGSTPGPVLRQLFAHDTFPEVLVTLVDERHGADLADSNTAALDATLAEVGATNPIARWDLPGGLEAARVQLDCSLPPIGVALLGMGPDGHIASLFPGRSWGGQGQRVLCVVDSPKPPPRRLSLTLDALGSIEHLVAVVRGAGKADAVRRAASLDPALPTSHLDSIHWFVDVDAATLLPENP